MTGLVDFDLKGCSLLGLLGSTCSHGNLLNTLVGLPVALLETFALDGPTVSRHVTLKKVEDLNLSIYTEFYDAYNNLHQQCGRTQSLGYLLIQEQLPTVVQRTLLQSSLAALWARIKSISGQQLLHSLSLWLYLLVALLCL